VLAHEVVHVDRQHGLAAAQSRRAGLVAAGIFDVLLGGTSIAYLPYISSAASFSREQESEADNQALPMLVKAGYDVSVAQHIFDVLEEIREGDALKGSAYASHPTNAARAEKVRSLLQDGTLHATGSEVGEQRYLAVRDEVLEQDIRLKLNVKRYQLALEAAERAARHDAGQPLWVYYRGEVYRRMADDPRSAAEEEARLHGKDYDEAMLKAMRDKRDEYYRLAKTYFRQVLDADQDFARAYRGLGLVYARQGEGEQTLAALNRYLALSPAARDVRYIKHVINKTESP
jgi:predicted Zn-dependent protease